MNLYKCGTCAKRSVCKFYDYNDPRMIEGTCKFYLEYIADKHPAKQTGEYKHQDTHTNLKPKQEQTDELKLGETVYRAILTTNPRTPCGWFVRSIITKPFNIAKLQKDFGNTVFRTKKEAEEVAQILRYTGGSGTD